VPKTVFATSLGTAEIGDSGLSAPLAAVHFKAPITDCTRCPLSPSATPKAVCPQPAQELTGRSPHELPVCNAPQFRSFTPATSDPESRHSFR
jgi:hypothetical protein